MRLAKHFTLSVSFVCLCASVCLGLNLDAEEPQVNLLWPPPQSALSFGLRIKIKAETSLANVALVEFMADETLIGTVTNKPYNLIWEIPAHPDNERGGVWNLKAVAVDTSGVRTESPTTTIFYSTTAPLIPDIRITSPKNGSILTDSFQFNVEQLASAYDGGPIEWFVGTSSLGLSQRFPTFTEETSYFSFPVTGLPEGEYQLRVEYRGLNGSSCECHVRTVTVRVVKLGLEVIRVLPEEGRIDFDLVTAAPGAITSIQRTSDFTSWIPITNVVPTSNRMRISDSISTSATAFYRAGLSKP